MNLLFKTIGLLFAVLFIVGAVVQYNDPDSFLWILIYLLAAVISILFSFNRLRFIVPLVIGTLCFIGFMYLYPSNFQGFGLDDGPIETVELGREAFGLLIIALVMFLYTVRLGRKSKI